MSTNYFPNLSKDLKKKRERVFFNSITGENVQMLYIRLETEECITHSHSNEQMGYILSGAVEIKIIDEVFVCKSGDGYYIPSYAEHSFKALNNSSADYIEMFSPIKEENL